MATNEQELKTRKRHKRKRKQQQQADVEGEINDEIIKKALGEFNIFIFI